jgi:hypothetical protein
LDLFGRARKVLEKLGTAEPPGPQFYRVACPEGHILRGQRTEGYQALRCPACGQGVFILPVSPLPEPPAPVAERPRRRPARPADEGPIALTEPPPSVVEPDPEPPGPEVEIEWDEPAPAPRPRPAPTEPTRPAAPGRPAAARPRPTSRPVAADVASGPRVRVPVRPGLTARLRRHRLPLAVLGVVALVLGTFAVRFRSERFAELPQVAREGREAGIEALAAARFDVARQRLETAARALERLRDPDAPAVRQVAREAAIFADLAGRGLEEIVDQAANHTDSTEWFETLYRDRAILVDDVVPDDPAQGLNYLILAGRRRGRLDLAGFTLLADKKPGDPVTFGARLRSIRLDNDDVWRITLQPDSGVFLTHEASWKAFEAIGGPAHSALVPDAAAAADRLIGVLVGLILAQPPADVIPVAELSRHLDQPVVVEPRNPRFDYTTRDAGWNVFTVPDSRVRFVLPARLGYRSPPSKIAAVRVRGIASRGADGLIFNASSIEELPGDLDRLRQAVAALSPRDLDGREAWTRWAEARAHEYHDDPELLQAARRLIGETIRIEADQPANASPTRQLELAERARSRQVPDPEPSALAHGPTRALLREVKSGADAEALARRVEALFPATKPIDRPPADLASWEARYQADPAGTLRQAPAPVRAALDRRLVADVLQVALEKKATEHPNEALNLADQAESQLADRPQVIAQVRRQGLDASDVAGLRLAEVQERARLYEQQGAREQARSLLRRWLDHQRSHNLSPTDAEGRVLLAGQFEDLAGDRATAAALLLEAWKIDPESREIADAFLRRGFRRVDGEWVAPADAAAKVEGAPADAAAPARAGRDPLEGLTRDEVRGQLGKPSQIARVATQGQVLEQWIYRDGRNNPSKFVNFLVRPGVPQPTAIASGGLRP